MAKGTGNDYFAMLADMAECSFQAAQMLEQIMGDFQVEKLAANMESLHAVEHEGDTRKHALVGKLVKEFITPIEREDIMDIASHIDDVTDSVEDVLLKIYMFNIGRIGEDAVAFAGILTRCCEEMRAMFREFGNFKKSKTLHASVVALNQLEEEGDALYIQAVRRLYESPTTDPREVAAWTEIYSCMENVCDTCEHAADLVEHVIMKNS